MKENTREISILKQRILQYLDSKGISKYECYKNTGITNGVLSQSNGMSEDNLLRFLSYYKDISTDWLLTGKGSMLRPDDPPTNSVTPSTDAPVASAKPDESILYNMYKDLQAEKEKIRLEKEAKIEELNAKMLAMSEEIGRLKAKLGEDEPEAESHPKGLGKGAAENASTKKPSSQSFHDVPFAAAPSDGR